VSKKLIVKLQYGYEQLWMNKATRKKNAAYVKLTIQEFLVFSFLFLKESGSNIEQIWHLPPFLTH